MSGIHPDRSSDEIVGTRPRARNALVAAFIVTAVSLGVGLLWLGMGASGQASGWQTLLAIAALVLVFSAYLMARQFLNYSLRTKFVVVTTTIVGAVALVSLYFASDRIQRTTETLRRELETAVRTEAEQLLAHTLEGEIVAADEVLHIVEDDSALLAAYAGDLLSREAILGAGDYWDARRSLTHVAGGPWDNSNSDVASVLVPSTADLSDAAVAELNAAKYLDLIAPETLHAHPDAVAVYFISAATGATIYYPNIDLASIVGDYDARPQSFFSVATPENNPGRKPIWTPPYQDPALTGLLVTSSAPVYDRTGRFRGVVATDVQLARVTERISNLEIGQSGYAFLIDQAAHALAMPGVGYADFGLTPESVPPGEPIRQTILGRGSPGLQNIVFKMISGESGVTTLDIGGAERYVAYGPLPNVDYSLAVVVPAAELNAPIIVANARIEEEVSSTQRWAIVILIAGLSLVAVTSAAVGRVLAAPVERLTHIAQRVTSGDLNVWADVRSRDELGTLSAAFNVMTARLRELIGSLEARVQARTEQLRASADVGRAAASILDPDQLLREIVNLITDRFGFYYAAVFMPDEDGRYAVLREATGEAGRVLKARGHRLEVGGQSMVGTAMATRKPRIALDVGDEPMRFANPLLPDTRSEIALPLVVRDRALGALDVQSTREAAFDEASAAVLQSMADHIAIALDNAGQYTREQGRARQFADLLSVMSELTGPSSRTTLLDFTIQHGSALLDADGAAVWLVAGSGELNVVASHSFDEPQGGRSWRTGEGLVGRVFASGHALRAESAPDVGTEQAADMPRHAILAVPLAWRGRPQGVVAFIRLRPGQGFSADDESIALLFVSQVASALENVSLLEQQRHMLDELDVINRRLTGEVWAEQFRVRGGWRVRVAQSGPKPIEQDRLPEIDLAVATRQPVAWSQEENPPSPSPYQSAMAAPIVLRGEVIGALQVGETTRTRQWSAEDLAFIQAVADQVALAVENARLLEQTQRAARRERVIAEAADRIHRPTDLETILRTAVEEVSRITGSSDVRVRLGVGAPPRESGE